MYCTKCGSEMKETDKFCTNCGARVEHTRVNTYPEASAELPPVTLGEAARLYISRYTDFSGRSRRSEYWGATAVVWAISLLLNLIFQEGSLLVTLWSLATLVPNLAISVRRLHDVGRSWTWLLWNLLPVVGQILILVAFCTDSQKQSNSWGESPKYR